MSRVTKSFIDKIQEFKDIDSAEVLKAGVRLMAATILMHLVARVLPGWVRILLLLLLLAQVLRGLVGLVVVGGLLSTAAW